MDKLEAIREIIAADTDLLLTVSFIRKILSVPETEAESILSIFHCFRRGEIPEPPAPSEVPTKNVRTLTFSYPEIP